MYRFALSPKWFAAHVLVAALAVTFVNLGLWQLRRLDARRTHNALVRERTRYDPVPVESALDLGGERAAYRRVLAEGTYEPSREVILLSRAKDGRPGNHVLTPLRTDAGTLLVVDRGWVPFEMNSAPVAAASPPPGEVRVTGMLLPADRKRSFGSEPDPGTGVVGRVDLAALRRRLGGPVAPVYLLLTQQSPPPRALPEPAPPPDLGDGPHLSYAVQWFSFAAIAIIGYGAVLRRAARQRS